MTQIPDHKLWPMPTTYRRYTIAFCTGCFDVLHRGHVELFLAAKYDPRRPRLLVVGLNSDAAIKRLKGEGRPINNQDDRMFMVAALECVSAVLLIDSDTVDAAIRLVKPDYWVKSHPWTLETLNAAEVAAANEVGAKILILPTVAGYSSTNTIERMGE